MTQNPFAVVGFVRPGLLRLVTIRVVMSAIDYAVRHVYNHASLAGISHHPFRPLGPPGRLAADDLRQQATARPRTAGTEPGCTSSAWRATSAGDSEFVQHTWLVSNLHV